MLVSALAFALAPVINAEQYPEGGPDPIQLGSNPTLASASAVVTIHSTDNVTREGSVHSCWL